MKSYAQDSLDVYLWTNRKRFGLPENGFFVEVGAGDGTNISNSLLLEENGWTGLLIEPDTRHHAAINASRKATLIPSAIGEVARPFVLDANPELSGFLRHGPSAMVNVETLNSIFEREAITHVDFLSIDTEGTELEVLRTIDLNRYRPQVIVIEAFTVGIGDRSKAVAQTLERLGYRLDKKLGANMVYVNAGINTEVEEHRARLDAFTAKNFKYPSGRFSGRGIIICGGGIRYFTNAYIGISLLRFHGCRLPIQLWHLGGGEIDEEMRDIVRPLDVTCVDAFEIQKLFPSRILRGYELKSFAILHCPFEEVLLLDADNMAVTNPEFLFSSEEYLQTGAIFWPDYGRLSAARSIWSITGVAYQDECEFESGQIVVNKSRCWKALNLTMFLNEWSDFYYKHIHGDKDTFHIAWRKLGQTYSMPSSPVRSLGGCVMVQSAFDGSKLFQHRNMCKWSLVGENEAIEGFDFHEECMAFLIELRGRWSLTSGGTSAAANAERRSLESTVALYCRVGYDFRELELLSNGRIGKGRGGNECLWFIGEDRLGLFLHLGSENDFITKLRKTEYGIWVGYWSRFEKMPIALLPKIKSN